MLLGEIGFRMGALWEAHQPDARCAPTATTLDSQKGIFEIDANAGYVMRPNVCLHLRSREYDEVLNTNSTGMVGPEVPTAKPSGEFRIVILGDSYTAGGQVPFEQNFAPLLEQQLLADGHSQVRVIAAAVGGWTTFNESGYLRANIGWLQPDLVIVAAFVGNDIAENILATSAGYRMDPDHPKGFSYGPQAANLLHESESWFPRNHLPRSASAGSFPPRNPGPAPTPVGNNYVPPDFVPPPRPTILQRGVRTSLGDAWRGLRRSSLLVSHLFGTPPNLSVTTDPGAQAWAQTRARLNVTSFAWTVLRDVPQTYWLDAAWPLFQTYLEQIHATAASVGAPTVLMIIPQMAQFDDAERARMVADYRFSDAEVQWDRPQSELNDIAHRANIPTLDLLPQFQARPDRARLYFRLNEHFTAVGHQATADALAHFLTSRGWVP